MNEQKKATTEDLERSAFGRVLARLMRSRGIPVDAETVERLAVGSGLAPENLTERMVDETSEHVGSLEGLRYALKLSKDEAIELALAFTLEIEDGAERAEDFEYLAGPGL
jgi:hypothetical protein